MLGLPTRPPMPQLEIQISGLPARPLGPEAGVVTVGRSLQNDLVVEDASLSRNHARFELLEGRLTLEDLGSRNGIKVNGVLIRGKSTVKPGDEIVLGAVPVALKDLQPPAPAVKAGPTVVFDNKAPGSLGNATLRMPAAMLRSALGRPANDWTQALSFIQELTLGLIRDVTPEQLLEDLMDRLFGFLDADRGVILLREGTGPAEPVVVRSRQGASSGKIRLSHTVVEAALQRREALLINDPINDKALGSESLIFSGVSTLIVTPLEAEGQVIGLLYFDAMPRREAFNEDDLRLVTTLAHIAAAKLQSARLMVEVQKTRALEQEMGFARTIQQRLLPHRTPEGGPFSLHAQLRAAKEVGGDLYDYFWDRDRFHFCIGDVSGKGVPAALVMAMTKTLFQANPAAQDDPSRLLAEVNLRLCVDTDASMFVTAFCGFLDLRDGRLVYSNAGHDRPVILPSKGSPQGLEAKSGLALGVFADFKYTLQEAVLEPGDGLFLYTDGATESMNAADELFRLPRLMDALAQCKDQAPAQVVASVLDAVDQFAGAAPQADDITLMCFRYLGA